MSNTVIHYLYALQSDYHDYSSNLTVVSYNTIAYISSAADYILMLYVFILATLRYTSLYIEKTPEHLVNKKRK